MPLLSAKGKRAEKSMSGCDYCDGCAALHDEDWAPAPAVAATCESEKKAPWLGVHRVLKISWLGPRGLIKIIRPAWSPGKEGE